jgi:Flp pilus assembly protein TadG
MSNGGTGIAAALRRRLPTTSHAETGQSMVEFAVILPLFLVMTVILIQFLLVGAVAFAVNQAVASCARYAALNDTYGQSTLNSYLQSVASPLINDKYLATIGVSPSTVPRTSGSSVTVTVSYNLSGNKLVLGSSVLGFAFPTTLAISETMVSN